MSETLNGVWNQWQADQYHQSSPKLAKWLSDFLPKDHRVIDFGCGNGFYISELAKSGFDCVGVEGFPLNNFLHDSIVIEDLTNPIRFDVPGSVISLEVGEHLPESAEQTFLDTLTDNCARYLVCSWALPGQPGVGHINCKPQKYIIREIERRGFMFLYDITAEARLNVDKNCDWFERTLMVFVRR